MSPAEEHGALWRWLDRRIGLADLEYLARKKQVPIHRHTVWYYFGGMTLFLFTIQVATGILLLFYYRPSAEEAYESVQFLMAAPFAASTHRSLPGDAGTARDNWHPPKTGLFRVNSE